MIPALLSAVYVYYLYRKLNSRASAASAENTTAGAAPPADDLQQRITALQSRLENLRSQSSGDPS